MRKHLTYNPIDIAGLFFTAHSPITGGIVMFSGEVRGVNVGKDVAYLEYEAYEPMAESAISKILKDAKSKWELNEAICVHRLGHLDISECAVVVITASAHRNDAYKANRYIIDRVKAEVPIWKKEVYTDETFFYGSNCECVNHNHEEEEHHHHHHEH